MNLDLPAGPVRLLATLRAEGGTPYVVGGAVRDVLLGLQPKDFDVEVFGLPAARLEPLLGAHGRVDAVGRPFVCTSSPGSKAPRERSTWPCRGATRRRVPGTGAIQSRPDPFMPVEEAARRRDFTINAMMFDLATGALVDPFGGVRDLEARVLRVVDPSTFEDDPRGASAAQFAARFDLTVEPATARLCASMPLGELPADRIFGEIEKALLQARRPSVAFKLLFEWDQFRDIAPELLPLAATPQDPEWHPEGDVWTHTLSVWTRPLLIDDLDPPRALAVMLGTLCHDLGKPATTKFEDGRIRSRGHEEAGWGLPSRFSTGGTCIPGNPSGRGPGSGIGEGPPQAGSAAPGARGSERRRHQAPGPPRGGGSSLSGGRADCLGRPGKLPTRGHGVVHRGGAQAVGRAKAPRPAGHGPRYSRTRGAAGTAGWPDPRRSTSSSSISAIRTRGRRWPWVDG